MTQPTELVKEKKDASNEAGRLIHLAATCVIRSVRVALQCACNR